MIDVNKIIEVAIAGIIVALILRYVLKENET